MFKILNRTSESNSLVKNNDRPSPKFFTHFFTHLKKNSNLKLFRVFDCKFNAFVKIVVYFLIFLIQICDFDELVKSKRYASSALASEKVCGEFVSDNSKTSKRKFSYDYAMVKNTLRTNESFICLYKFIAKKNEKVKITFDSFDVKSLAPECVNEYIDIYIEVNEKNINNYVETNFLSRWCGWKRPNVLVSFHNVIVFAYHNDGWNRGTKFSGNIEFIEAEPYNIGRKALSVCEYEFRSEMIEQGMFMSPTYPGTYPNILNCSYKFIGRPNERVSIHFEDISLHYGADHCPYDAIRLFDYQRNSANSNVGPVKSNKKNQQINNRFDRVLIDTRCGKKANFEVFSSNSLFEVEFEMSDSLSNEEYSEDETKILLRNGFRAFFRFSKNYADLSFITGTHITGTNCDQRITSKEATGVILSPNYFHPTQINATCKYIFEGLNDQYNFESVKLQFLEVNLRPPTVIDVCNEQSVSHFVVYDSDKKKSKNCFVYWRKNELKSHDSEMTLVFKSIVNSEQYLTQSKFKANYTFYTEFGIEGTRVYQNRTCLFTYNSESVKYGKINSPRYPDNYPLNLRCTYLFNIASRYERILFTFKEFRLPNMPDRKECVNYEDNLSVYQANEENDDNFNTITEFKKRDRQNWSLLHRYCGNSVPSPFITDENTKLLKFVFYSDNVNHAQGFEFDYNYVRLPECLYNYFTSSNVSSGQIVVSNDLRANYYCDWYITTEPDKILLLSFKNQNLEDLRQNQFIIRVYDLNELPAENAREKEDRELMRPKIEYFLDKSTKYFEVNSHRIRIQLVIGKSMLLDGGRLTINWVSAGKDRPCQRDEFTCAQNNYCIKARHFCDRVEHCPDFSDEPERCYIRTAQSSFPVAQMSIFLGSVVVLIIVLSMCIYCRIKTTTSKKKKAPAKNPQFAGPPIYYKYSPANSMDYLEAAITSV